MVPPLNFHPGQCSFFLFPLRLSQSHILRCSFTAVSRDIFCFSILLSFLSSTCRPEPPTTIGQRLAVYGRCVMSSGFTDSTLMVRTDLEVWLSLEDICFHALFEQFFTWHLWSYWCSHFYLYVSSLMLFHLAIVFGPHALPIFNGFSNHVFAENHWAIWIHTFFVPMIGCSWPIHHVYSVKITFDVAFTLNWPPQFKVEPY
jgi:hypothetical protein